MLGGATQICFTENMLHLPPAGLAQSSSSVAVSSSGGSKTVSTETTKARPAPFLSQKAFY